MRHLKVYESFTNESIWNSIFGKPTVDRAAKDSLRAQGHSHMKKEEDELYVVFQGQQFKEEDVEYASVYDTGQIPRIENGKLIIANPQWRE